jgi:C4-dicarboxylate-specific signal transduction histidine kinase
LEPPANPARFNPSALKFLDVSSVGEATTAIQTIYSSEEFPLEDLLQAVYEGKRRFEGRCALTMRTGNTVNVSIIVTLPREEEKISFRVVVAVLELTTEVSLHPHFRAVQAERLRSTRIASAGAFSASMGHELAQPLGALVLNAQTCLRWLKMDPPGIESAVSAAERVVSNSERLNGIAIRARSFLNSAPFAGEQVRIADLVEDVCSALSAKIRVSGAVVEISVTPGLPAVLTNKREMEQILTDVLVLYLEPVNHMPFLKVVTINLSEVRSGYVRVSFETNPASNPCSSMSAMVCSSGADIALAFALSRATVEALGGSLTLASDTCGENLSIDLPVAACIICSQA